MVRILSVYDNSKLNALKDQLNAAITSGKVDEVLRVVDALKDECLAFA